MNKILLFFFTVCVINSCFCAKAKVNRQSGITGCKITLPTDIPENEPVYLIEEDGKLELFRPAGRENYFKINQELQLFCPGKNNKLTNNADNRNLTEISCKPNFKFGTSSKDYLINSLNCTKEIAGDWQTKKTKCAGNIGFISEIGFKITPTKFVTLFETCYNNNTASVIYSVNDVNGRAIKYNVKENERRTFKSSGVPSSAQPSKSYKKANQITHFNKVLGDSQTYFNNTSFLSRGHLTPDADFVFSSGQLATYFYVNVAPQFQDVNGGNWVRLEGMAKNLSEEYNSNFLVYTGVHEILSLPDESGNLKPLYLEDGNKIEVPKWFWKVIINRDLDSAIVMITLNNPFEKKNNIQEFCKNVCDKAGLRSSWFSNIRKGYTFCCDLNDFRKTVTVLPSSLRANNLLGCSSIFFG